MTVAEIQAYPKTRLELSAIQEKCSMEPPQMKSPEAAEDRNYSGMLPAEVGTDYTFKRKIVWKNAIGFLALHLAALYGLWLIVAECYWTTDLWGKKPFLHSTCSHVKVKQTGDYFHWINVVVT